MNTTGTPEQTDPLSVRSAGSETTYQTVLEDLWERSSTVVVHPQSNLAFLIGPQASQNDWLRWAVLNQTIIKYFHPHVSATVLQKKAGFNSRTFCSDVTVPFNRMHGSPIPDSSDPYVSKPLRQPYALDTPDNRQDKRRPELWTALCRYLLELDEMEPDDVEERLLQLMSCLRGHATVRQQVSANLATAATATLTPRALRELLTEYVETPSGGRRTQIALAALAEVKPNSVARTHRVNASDASTGNVLDIDVLVDGELSYVLEAKEYAPKLEYLIAKIHTLADHADLAEVPHVPLVFISPEIPDAVTIAQVQAEAKSYDLDVRFAEFRGWIGVHTSTLTLPACERVLSRLADHAERFGSEKDREDLAFLIASLTDTVPAGDIQTGDEVVDPEDEASVVAFRSGVRSKYESGAELNQTTLF